MKKLIYNLLDFITSGKGISIKMNGFSFKMPARWFRYYKDGYEKETFLFIKNKIKPGNTVLDIGAHIGLYVNPFSKLVGETGKVFSFEPTDTTFKVLQQTIQLNHLNNVFPVQAAISDKKEILTFHLTTIDGEGSNANSIIQRDENPNSIKVQAFSIDTFRAENNLKIDFLKIDVEGAEALALKGGKETFRQDQPSGILALHPDMIKKNGNSLEEIWDLLVQYGCSVYFEKKTITKQWFIEQANLFDVEFDFKQ